MHPSRMKMKGVGAWPVALVSSLPIASSCSTIPELREELFSYGPYNDSIHRSKLFCFFDYVPARFVPQRHRKRRHRPVMVAVLFHEDAVDSLDAV